MANKENEVKNGAQVEETNAEETTEQTTTVVVKQKTGVGTAVKIAVGLTVGAALTGLGWVLRGIFGGGQDDDSTEAAVEQETEE